MPSLRELQIGFAAALFAEQPSSSAWSAGGDPLGATAGLATYRNNLREGFRKALALEFPVIEQLVGADYFRQLALQFLAAHPSRSGDLSGIGAPFPQWLREQFAGTRYSWFADVATLEWALEELRIAAEVPSADVADLATIDPASYAALALRLHPAARLLAFEAPAASIWLAHQNDPPAAVDLMAGGERVLVRARAECFEFHRLSASEHSLLEGLGREEPLGAAVERVLASDPDIDLTLVLGRLLAIGALVIKAE